MPTQKSLSFPLAMSTDNGVVANPVKVTGKEPAVVEGATQVAPPLRMSKLWEEAAQPELLSLTALREEARK